MSAWKQQCYVFHAENDNMYKEIFVDLNNNHTLLESQIILHLRHIDKIRSEEETKIKIIANKVDIVMYVLHHLEHLSPTTGIWIELGCHSKKSFGSVNINDVANNLADNIKKCLVGYNIFTGCEWEPYFFGKGKTKSFAVLKSDESYQKGFQELGNSHTMTEISMKSIQKYTCDLYNSRKSNVDEARFQTYNKISEIKGGKVELTAKGIDFRTMPPCNAVLMNKLRRSNYLAYNIKNAHLRSILSESPEENGWILEEEKDDQYVYKLKYYDGLQYPVYLNDYFPPNIETDQETEATNIDSSDDEDQDPSTSDDELTDDEYDDQDIYV